MTLTKPQAELLLLISKMSPCSATDLAPHYPYSRMTIFRSLSALVESRHIHSLGATLQRRSRATKYALGASDEVCDFDHVKIKRLTGPIENMYIEKLKAIKNNPFACVMVQLT